MMTEYIVCGIIVLLSIGGLIAITVAKTKIGWSWVNKENE